MRENSYAKRTNTLHVIMFGVGLGLILGGLTNILASKNKSREKAKLENHISETQAQRCAYLINSPETYQINTDKRILDSLADANTVLFDVNSNKYFNGIDKKYTMGRFFNASEIAMINKTLEQYTNDTELASCMPLGAKTPIVQFEDIVRATGIAPSKLMPAGVEFDCGYIFRFRDAADQKLFESYLAEIDAAFDEDENPNFDIREFAPMRAEYDANCAKMDSIQNDIHRNDSIRGAKLAEFDRTIDSLQNKLDKVR